MWPNPSPIGTPIFIEVTEEYDPDIGVSHDYPRWNHELGRS